MPDGGKGEVSFKAAIRSARYVGESANERIQLRQRLSRSYGERSSVVHGGKPKEARFGDALDVAEVVLRRAIRLWPDKPHGEEDIDGELLA